MYPVGITTTRLQRGATFAAKASRAAPPPPPPRRRAITKEQSEAKADPASSNPAAINFSALAARAATTQLAPEKEAAVAAILDKIRSLRAYATDTDSFDRNLGVEDTLPDALNG